MMVMVERAYHYFKKMIIENQIFLLSKAEQHSTLKRKERCGGDTHERLFQSQIQSSEYMKMKKEVLYSGHSLLSSG